ncbi:Opi10p NDAI_0A08480 [Naumovozyma dairenensis CBS 421]|uniref:Uncharacterized protein n=1 Tax=Naumovozyma dairenensis (strain ATCC 10597 / BCRC 20456 / CBS 421 / NBRC 0211 / NRRL Y-12639) TaxID=1071378 RepID=G0W5B3_NAUDC|nr:hypothetical protein NDAI_0A08480 [Naumovozyma dairenensis CBS 421]CCD23001.1 hypothetical protein NDAI_0A08480 [Naumovozyma dairenensis CBS 421]
MFAAIASGNPLQFSEEVANSNGLQHTIVLSSTKPKSYSHISLFVLPNVTFPEDYIATVYFKLSPLEDFKMFGYLSAEKPSAIFKVKLQSTNNNNNLNNTDTRTSRDGIQYGEGLGEIDMDEDEDQSFPHKNSMNFHNISQLIIGISIEPRMEGMAKLEAWKHEMAMGSTQIPQMPPTSSSSSLALMKPTRNITTAGQLARLYPALTQELAGKIVQHAYNYLSGFLDSMGNVSIKRFDTWWDKFKKRLANDGTFLDEVTSS